MHQFEVLFHGRKNGSIGIAYDITTLIGLPDIRIDELPTKTVFALGKAGYEVNYIKEITELRYNFAMRKIVRCQHYNLNSK